MERIKQAAKLLPYLLPAIVLSVSLASSLLVAGGSPQTGPYSPLSMPSGPTPTPTVPPTPTPPPPPPPGTLHLSSDANNGDSFNTGHSILVTTDRINENRPPVMVPNVYLYRFSATIGTPLNIPLNEAGFVSVSDPDNNTFTISVPANTGHGTVSIAGTVLTYTATSRPTSGVDIIPVELTDSYGASGLGLVDVNVP